MTAQPEVVDFARSLLRRAEMGLIGGLVCVISVEGAENEIGFCGDFSEDSEYAIRSVGKGLVALINRQHSH